MIQGTRSLLSAPSAARATAPTTPLPAVAVQAQARPSAAPGLNVEAPVAHPSVGGLWGALQSVFGWVRGRFMRGTPPEPEPVGGGGRTVTVRSGDSLSAIAQRELGSAGRWREIYDANRDKLSNPNVIFPGQVLRLPGGQAAPRPAPAPATVRVQSGDTLSKLAQRALGDGNRWREIYDANRDQLSNPNLIFPGMVLKVPGGRSSSPAPAPTPSAPGRVDFPLSAEQIASALRAPVENVRKYWPAIAQACAEAGITDRNSIIAVLATIGVETGRFEPIPEYASGWAYEGRKDLGNLYPGDGPRYKGRGFIQITGRANYRTYGKLLGVPLEANPDLALNADTAAKVLASYFKQRGIPAMAQRGDWLAVRKAVNGGTNGWSTFQGHVQRLQAALR